LVREGEGEQAFLKKRGERGGKKFEEGNRLASGATLTHLHEWCQKDVAEIEDNAKNLSFTRAKKPRSKNEIGGTIGLRPPALGQNARKSGV